MTVCVDASMVVRRVIDPDDLAVSNRWDRWIRDGVDLVAPDLIFYEITNALYRYQLGGQRTTSVILGALRVSRELPIRLYLGADLHERALDFAGRFGLRATYDAHYLALADRLGVEFWTVDRRLAHAVQHQLNWVRLVED